MSQTLMLTQALLALLGMFGGAWLLLNPKSRDSPKNSLTTAAINLSVAAYLLCNIGITQAADTGQLANREKWATGFAILVLALLPGSFSRLRSLRSTGYLIANACIALGLLALNYLQPISLRFESFPAADSQVALHSANSSKLLFLYLAFVFSTISLLVYRVTTESRNEATSPRLLISSTALALVTSSCIESYQIRTGEVPVQMTWVAMVLIAITSNFQYLRNSSPSFPPSREGNHPPATPDSHATVEIETPREHLALLLWLNEQDAALASKLLSTQDYTVMREDQDSDIPEKYFDDKRIDYSVIFNRDQHPSIPPSITKMRKQTKACLSIIAITQNPRAPRILREIRNDRYQHAITSPIKARELFSSLTSQRKDASHWPPTPSG